MRLYGPQSCDDEASQFYDVSIRQSDLFSAPLPITAKITDGQFSGAYNGHELLLEYTNFGRFLVRSGKEIIADTRHSQNRTYLNIIILDVVFAALCHQRGIAPLHASTIGAANGCVAFVGPSGAGKSTLIAAQAQRGYRILADDECFLELKSKDEVITWPGIPGQIRLKGDVAKALGLDGRENRPDIDHGKRVISLPKARNGTAPRPLLGVYQILPSESGDPKIELMSGGDAMQALLQNIYPPHFAVTLNCLPKMFEICAAAAQHAKIFRYYRPRDVGALHRANDLMHAHLESMFELVSAKSGSP